MLTVSLILLTDMLVTLREDKKRLCKCLPQCDDVKFAVDFAEHIKWQVKKEE
jgi:hypothetical protein